MPITSFATSVTRIDFLHADKLIRSL